MPLTLEQVKEHIPGEITEDMVRFARDEVFGTRHYAFVYNVGTKKNRARMAFCTHCGHKYPVEDLAHRSKINCPNCGVTTTAYYSWYSKGGLLYYGYMMYWQKSAIDQNVVTAIGASLKINVGAAWDNLTGGSVPPIEAALEDMFVFTPCLGSTRFSRMWHDFYSYGRENGWVRKDTITSQTSWWGGKTDNAEVAEYTFHAAVAGTDFERMGVRYYFMLDGIECMDMASKWPSFEYIHKLGFGHLIMGKIRGNPTYSAINWRGKTMQKVLGLTKADLAEIRREKLEPDALDLRVLRLSRGNGETLTVKDACEASCILSGSIGYVDREVLQLLKIAPAKKLADYVKAQVELRTTLKTYSSASTVCQDYMDYIKQCRELGLDLSDTAIKWPRDLRAAHENLTKQIKYKQNELMDKAIRALKLPQYYFEYGGLIIRPFISSKEIIDEGTALSHCVGGYVESYAKGNIVLCALRRADRPDEPWHTVEFSARDGRLYQCRGYKNQTKPEDKPIIDAFWQAFEQHRAKKARKSA